MTSSNNNVCNFEMMTTLIETRQGCEGVSHCYFKNDIPKNRSIHGYHLIGFRTCSTKICQLFFWKTVRWKNVVRNKYLKMFMLWKPGDVVAALKICICIFVWNIDAYQLFGWNVGLLSAQKCWRSSWRHWERDGKFHAPRVRLIYAWRWMEKRFFLSVINSLSKNIHLQKHVGSMFMQPLFSVNDSIIFHYSKLEIVFRIIAKKNMRRFKW